MNTMLYLSVLSTKIKLLIQFIRDHYHILIIGIFGMH